MKLEQQEKSSDVIIKEEQGRNKRHNFEVISPSLKSAVSKKHWEEERQLFFDHVIEAIKMSILINSFPSDKLSNNDFNHVQYWGERTWPLFKVIYPRSPSPHSRLVPSLSTASKKRLATGLQDTSRTTEKSSAALHSRLCGQVTSCEGGLQNEEHLHQGTRFAVQGLNRLNSELKSEEWRFIHKLIEPYYTRCIFEVDQVAAEAIKWPDYGAYMSLDRWIFKNFKWSKQT